MFLYQDPCGIRGLRFDIVRHLLQRNASTEILSNMRSSALHRLAAQAWTAAHQPDPTIYDSSITSDVDFDPIVFDQELLTDEPAYVDELDVTEAQIVRWHGILNEVFGGPYWRDYLLRGEIEAAERVKRVLLTYRNRLRTLTRFAASCPISKTPASSPLHYLTFCSRHPDALILMNNAMRKATKEYDYAVAHHGTLFDKTRWSGRSGKEQLIVDEVNRALRKSPGMSRRDTVASVLGRRFRTFMSKEVTEQIGNMYKRGDLTSDRARLNDDACLWINQKSLL